MIIFVTMNNIYYRDIIELLLPHGKEGLKLSDNRTNRDGGALYINNASVGPIKNIEFRHIINLEENNLICAFSLTNILVININSFSINCNLSLPKNLYLDPRTKPFILSHKDHTICFRQQTSLSTFDYKKMKLIKTIDLSKNAPFQIF